MHFQIMRKVFLWLVLITTTTKPVNTHSPNSSSGGGSNTSRKSSIQTKRKLSGTVLTYGYFPCGFHFILTTRPKTELLCYFTFYGIRVCVWMLSLFFLFSASTYYTSFDSIKCFCVLRFVKDIVCIPEKKRAVTIVKKRWHENYHVLSLKWHKYIP